MNLELPSLPTLSGFVKRYLVGGQNKLHTHLGEDHYFFVIAGEATLRLEADGTNWWCPLMRRSSFLAAPIYSFQRSGTTKLINLRIANAPRIAARARLRGDRASGARGAQLATF